MTGPDAILGIEFAPPGERMRKVVSRSNTRPTGLFPSRRAGRPLCWDSPAELNFFRLLECDPAVVEVTEQPCVIHYRRNGQYHRHVPDCLVRTATAKQLWEVKTAAHAAASDVLARTRLLMEHAPRLGYEYRVALAEDLRCEPRLSNARLLLRQGRSRPLTFEQREYARALLESAEGLKWDDVVQGRLGLVTVSVACRLVLEGVLHVDLEQALTEMTVLRKVRPAADTVGAHG